MLLSYARIVLISAALALSAAAVSAQSNSKQATEAAKKHQADKASEKSMGAKPAASKASVAQGLEACKKTASWNVVKREQCVWNLCKGRWGKQGCPAEATSKPSTSG